MQDNLARQLPQPQYQPRRESQPVRRTLPQKKHKFRWSVLIVGLICFGLSMIMIQRFAYLNEIDQEITNVQKQLFLVQASNEQKTLKIEESMDLKKLEEIATQQLGMCKPSKNQVVYVEVTNQDSAEILHQEKNQGILSEIMQSVKVLWNKVTTS